MNVGSSSTGVVVDESSQVQELQQDYRNAQLPISSGQVLASATWQDESPTTSAPSSIMTAEAIEAYDVTEGSSGGAYYRDTVTESANARHSVEDVQVQVGPELQLGLQSSSTSTPVNAAPQPAVATSVARLLARRLRLRGARSRTQPV